MPVSLTVMERSPAARRFLDMDQQQLLKFANETPKVWSLLYDLDLLPEQTVDKPAYAMTMNVIAHCVALRAEALRYAANECQVFIEAEAEKLENP